MNWKSLDKRTRLNLIGAVILAAGLLSAAVIYQRAGNDPYGTSGYEFVDGNIYRSSKMYRHNLEVYGGKFNVIMDDFRRWFLGLWQGKSLAFMLGGTAVMISCGLFYKANYLIEPLKAEGRHENNSEETG